MQVYRVMRGIGFKDVWFTTYEEAKSFRDKLLHQVEQGDEEIDSFTVYESAPELYEYHMFDASVDKDDVERNLRSDYNIKEYDPLTHSDFQMYLTPEGLNGRVHVTGSDKGVCEKEYESLINRVKAIIEFDENNNQQLGR